MRQEILAWIQIIISLLLILSVLGQQRGGGTGSILGGTNVVAGGEFYRTRVGIEKFLTYLTGILATLLIITSFMYFFI